MYYNYSHQFVHGIQFSRHSFHSLVDILGVILCMCKFKSLVMMLQKEGKEDSHPIPLRSCKYWNRMENNPREMIFQLKDYKYLSDIMYQYAIQLGNNDPFCICNHYELLQ